MQRLLSLITLLLIVFACDQGDAETITDPSPFYDLSGFITTETDRLTTAKTEVEKTITLNGGSETQKIQVINFSNDLRLFREADINKPAWFDKYATEERELSAGHTITTYTALDSSLIVRRLKVEQDQGATTKVEIERHTGSVLSDGRHLLTYEPARGYEVITRQKNKFGDDVDAVISVRW